MTNKKKFQLPKFRWDPAKFFASLQSFYHTIFMPRKMQPNFVLSVGVTVAKLLLVLVLVLGVSGIGVALGVAQAYYATLPEMDLNRVTNQNLSSFIYDRNGELITIYKGLENRVWADIDDMPDNLKNAFIAVEDARFYTHNGVDIKRIAGAFINNMNNDTMQGGSTITQQLVKLRLLSLEQTYKRKIQEAYMALELEEEIGDKDEILALYLNTILLGESNYGVQAAAQDYFGKELDQLTLRECAMLAGITRNPTRYNPRRCIYTTETPEVSTDRTNYVLECMYTNNFITRDEYDRALDGTPELARDFEAGRITQEEYAQRLAAKMHIVEESTINELYPMTSAVEAVLSDVETQLLIQDELPDTSANRRMARQRIQSGGYRIYSTINPKIQAIAEDTIYNWDAYPKLLGGTNAEMERDVDAAGNIIEIVQPQAAVSIFDYRSGEIVAMVGSRTPPTQFLTYNRARDSVMPVGSSIKPIAVYGPALDLGGSPASITINLPVPIPGWNGGKGYPANSTTRQHMGLITYRHAIVNSLNTAAANTLMNHVGINDSKNYLVSLGIDPDHIFSDPFGLSLGSSGITPEEMSVAFGTIANAGTYQMPLTFTRVVDSDGNIVLDMKRVQAENTRQVFQPGTAWMLVDMLVNAVRSGTGTPARIDGVTVGGKTGTNSDYAGASFSGFTPYYSCSIWVGSDENKKLYSGATGGKEAAPIFQAIMSRVHEELALEDHPVIEATPESLGLTQVTTCSLSGKLVTEACRMDGNFPPVTDWWAAGTVPTETCDMHVSAHMCLDTGLVAGNGCFNRIPNTYLLIPEDTPEGNAAELMPPDQLSAYLPNALLHAPGTQGNDILGAPVFVPPATLLEQMRQNPLSAHYFCPLHPHDPNAAAPPPPIDGGMINGNPGDPLDDGAVG